MADSDTQGKNVNIDDLVTHLVEDEKLGAFIKESQNQLQETTGEGSKNSVAGRAKERIAPEYFEKAPFDISFAFAKRYGVVVKKLIDKDLATIYCLDNIAPITISELLRISPIELDFEPVGFEQFESLLHSNYEQGEKDLENIDLGDNVDLLSVAQQLSEPEDLLESEDDAPIIRLINAILATAIKEGASDIHIEPFEKLLVVRIRVDGVLREIIQPPRELSGLLVSRIKVMAQLDIAEKRVPQDGRISLKLAGKSIDVRVSTLPTGGGERVVMRLLDNQAGQLDLEHLGMDKATRKLLHETIKKPHGIILVTGPTGSGKTTTLYAALSQLNNNTRNLITIEDPIEYYLNGVGQTQVNNKVKLTFARGLRAILRQDPDVVMVGEIRDSETADIAVQASLTGHLVLSTLHTNTAVGSITRLRDMGVEPFLLSSSLVAVLAQRLVRVLCPNCREEYEPERLELEKLGINRSDGIHFSRPIGCSLCNYNGYKGRTGIYELLLVDDEIRRMIHTDASEQTIEAEARKKTPSVVEDAARLVRQHITSTDEVFRVISNG